MAIVVSCAVRLCPSSTAAIYVSGRWRKADPIFQFGLFSFVVGWLYDYPTFLGNEEARQIVKPHAPMCKFPSVEL